MIFRGDEEFKFCIACGNLMIRKDFIFLGKKFKNWTCPKCF
jgi:hypothetical protein